MRVQAYEKQGWPCVAYEDEREHNPERDTQSAEGSNGEARMGGAGGGT